MKQISGFDEGSQLMTTKTQHIFKPVVYVKLRRKVATKVAFNGDGSERRWVRQAVMGVLRWRDLPGTRSSMGPTVQREGIQQINSLPAKNGKRDGITGKAVTVKIR
ncbi:hypothetical protein Bhyg_04898 [Pseudolycoriella hygida]|uniref:Uncharacterized protein n=1 Tax=Pseudolycoriella hygida TaxID=35572 RepID=A0A9Q0SAF8_9DIPT|nr:hypothetical protein Bhyg_04898 [Pseudolycoriella hygida]